MFDAPRCPIASAPNAKVTRGISDKAWAEACRCVPISITIIELLLDHNDCYSLRTTWLKTMSRLAHASSAHAFEHAFLGGQAEATLALRSGGDTFISQGNSRQIGRIENHNYYTSGPPRYSPVLEWLWPHSALSSDSPATALFTKQSVIHKSSTEARKHQSGSWLFKRREYEDWLTGKPLWIRGKGANEFYPHMIMDVYSRV